VLVRCAGRSSLDYVACNFYSSQNVFYLKDLLQKKIYVIFYKKERYNTYNQRSCVCAYVIINYFYNRKNRVTYFRYEQFSFFKHRLLYYTYRPPAIRVVFISSPMISYRYCANSFFASEKTLEISCDMCNNSYIMYRTIKKLKGYVHSEGNSVTSDNGHIIVYTIIWYYTLASRLWLKQLLCEIYIYGLLYFYTMVRTIYIYM